MLVFASAAERWRALPLATKAALPIEDLVVVAGATATRQFTTLGGRVKPALHHRLLLVLPLPTTTTSAIQVFDVGDGAVQFVRDVQACFPTLVRKNPLAVDDDDDDNDEDDDATKKPSADGTAARLQAEADAAVAAFTAATRVRVLPSLADLHEVYALESDALVAAVERDVHQYATSAPVALQFLCIECPAAAPSTTAGALNVGVVVTHALPAPPFLHIPLLREPSGFFPHDSEISDEPSVFQDATVYTFNSKRESSEHGGGKTSVETVQNIRLRHASGTFCTLVLPTTTWGDVVQKYKATMPLLQELSGEMRSRRFMGTVPNHPATIRREATR